MGELVRQSLTNSATSLYYGRLTMSKIVVTAALAGPIARKFNDAEQRRAGLQMLEREPATLDETRAMLHLN
jgi:hypothetical protein